MSSPRIASNRLLQQPRRRTALLIALGGWKTQIFTDSCNLTLTPTFHPNFTVMRQQERLQERRWWRPICAQWPESARWFAATPHAVQAPHKKKLSKGAQVNERISKAQSPKEIGEIITSLPTQGQQLTAVHVSTALSRLCSLNKKCEWFHTRDTFGDMVMIQAKSWGACPTAHLHDLSPWLCRAPGHRQVFGPSRQKVRTHPCSSSWRPTSPKGWTATQPEPWHQLSTQLPNWGAAAMQS